MVTAHFCAAKLNETMFLTSSVVGGLAPPTAPVKLFIDCDFIEFILCKNDESIFKCFTTRMEIDEQKKVRGNNEIYHREVFYPKCN